MIPPIALYDVYASNGLLDTERKVGKVTSSCRDETAFCQVSVSRNSNKDLGIRKIATGNVLSSIESNLAKKDTRDAIIFNILCGIVEKKKILIVTILRRGKLILEV